MYSRGIVGLVCITVLAVLLVAGCGGGGGQATAPAGGADLAAVQPNAAGVAKVMIGFTQAPGDAEKALVESVGGTVARVFHLIPAIAATVPGAAVEQLRANPSVAYVEGDAEARIPSEDMATPALAGVAALQVADDVLTWGADRIDADVVWGRYELPSTVVPPPQPPSAYGVNVYPGAIAGAGVKIAVLSSGINYNHPDVAANYKGGYDFVDDDADPMDNYGHGTGMAQVIAGADNAFGIIGVAPKAEIYGVRVAEQIEATWSRVIAGIEWCVDNDMQIAVIAPSSEEKSASLKDACREAWGKGLLLIAGSQNDGSPTGQGQNVQIPSAYQYVIAVASTGTDELRYPWSSVGPAIELSAPGFPMYLTDASGVPSVHGGPSFAACYVAGTAALVISSGVASTAEEVRNRLQSTAEDLGVPGRDREYGYGMVDAVAATGTAPPLNDETGDLVGYVTDATTGAPLLLAPVVVTDTGQATVTPPPAAGGYRIQDIAPGTHTVMCAPSGYTPMSQTVEIPADGFARLDFHMTSE